MDRFDLLRVFLRVAEIRNFTAAADQLGLPRATVSAAVQQLEARLGVRLLHRTTRRVALTPDGEVLFARADCLVADMEALERLFHPGAGRASGRLRVDLPSRIARRLVAPALPDFLQHNPEVEILLGSSDRVIDLVEEGVDCALRVGQLTHEGLVARPLGRFPIINCASPAYVVRHGMPGCPQDLDSHMAVNYVSRSSGRTAPWECVDVNGELHTLQLSSQVSTDNAETYIACAIAGLGLIQVPRYDVMHLLASGSLVEVLPDVRAAPMPVHLVYPHRRHLSQRVAVFMDWVEGVLRPHVEPF